MNKRSPLRVLLEVTSYTDLMNGTTNNPLAEGDIPALLITVLRMGGEVFLTDPDGAIVDRVFEDNGRLRRTHED